MKEKTIKDLADALAGLGFEISELKEEYRKSAPDACVIVDYGEKTGAILLRITPKLEEDN